MPASSSLPNWLAIIIAIYAAVEPAISSPVAKPTVS
jgi:hypothetical protein